MVEIQPGLIFLTRADWGARTDIPRLGFPVNRLDRTEAIIHHTVVIDSDATPNRWETLAEVKAKMLQLQTIRPDLGLDVPYNDVAFHMEDGTLIICEGRGFDRTGAHTHAHNTSGMATAGQGNFQTGQTVEAYADHWSRWWGYQRYEMGMENLGSVRPTSGPNAFAIAFGHWDFIATGCPGDNLYAIIPQLTFKEDDMGMTPAESEAIWRQIDAMRGALGLPAVQFPDESDAMSGAPLLGRVEAVETHAANAAHHLSIGQIKAGHGPHGSTGGVSPAEARTIAEEEVDRLRLTKS